MTNADSHDITFHPTISSSSSEDLPTIYVPTLTLPSPAISSDASFPPLPEEPSSIPSFFRYIQHTDPLLPPPVTHPGDSRHLSSHDPLTPLSVFYLFLLPSRTTDKLTESILLTFDPLERANLPRGFPYTSRMGILSFAWEFMCGLQGLVLEHLGGQGGHGRYREPWRSL